MWKGRPQPTTGLIFRQLFANAALRGPTIQFVLQIQPVLSLCGASRPTISILA